MSYYTLLMRFHAPMQSYGLHQGHDERGTEMYPTKSAVIGLVANALGRRRNDSIDDLRALRLGIRVDDEGQILRDFQTVRGAIGANNRKKHNAVRNKFYLQDAMFLVGLETEDAWLLQAIKSALKRPARPLFLGRKSCPPSLPVYLPMGFYKQPLEKALSSYPWLRTGIFYPKNSIPENVPVTYVIEDNTGIPVMDNPKDFMSHQRGWRRTKETKGDIGLCISTS